MTYWQSLSRVSQLAILIKVTVTWPYCLLFIKWRLKVKVGCFVIAEDDTSLYDDDAAAEAAAAFARACAPDTQRLLAPAHTPPAIRRRLDDTDQWVPYNSFIHQLYGYYYRLRFMIYHHKICVFDWALFHPYFMYSQGVSSCAVDHEKQRLTTWLLSDHIQILNHGAKAWLVLVLLVTLRLPFFFFYSSSSPIHWHML